MFPPAQLLLHLLRTDYLHGESPRTGCQVRSSVAKGGVASDVQEIDSKVDLLMAKATSSNSRATNSLLRTATVAVITNSSKVNQVATVNNPKLVATPMLRKSIDDSSKARTNFQATMLV
jgi:hypothetical protein